MSRHYFLLAFLSLAQFSSAEDVVQPATYQQAALSKEVVSEKASTEKLRAKSERIYHIVRTRGANASSVAMLVQLSRDLPEDASAQLFSRLAGEWHEAGEIDLASECRRTLLRKFPDSPEAKLAFLRLIQTYSSGELAHAHRLTAAIKSSSDEQPANRQMLTYAGLLATQTIKANKALEGPTLQWHRGTIQRLLGQEKAAIGLHTPLKRRPPGDAYRQRVDLEEWLAGDRQSPAPLPTIACSLSRAEREDGAAEKPYLDGVLDETIWQTPEKRDPASKSPAPKPQAVRVQFAYDTEYLYLAIKAEKETSLTYELDDHPRQRDAELSQFDRVRILLDVDRDYATGYELTIDQRGWSADACWGDATWNPEWFIAADSSGRNWQIEAAVSWNSLVDSPPAAGDAWAVRCERLLPEQVVTAKTPAAGFSVILFE